MIGSLVGPSRGLLPLPEVNLPFRIWPPDPWHPKGNPGWNAFGMEMHWGLWAAFIFFVVIMLGLDLVVFNRPGRVVRVRDSLWLSGFWVSLAGLFGVWVWWRWGSSRAIDFITGYVVEESLSVDNLFVFLMIFNYFKVPRENQQRVLFWGIIGAIVLRAVFIFTGVWLLERFSWLIYLFGAFLIFTGIKLLGHEDEEIHPEKNIAIRLLRKIMPVTHEYSGGRYFVHLDGRRIATPLFVVIIALATTDLVFALDSIPTILGITQERFIVFSSNIFAVLGLRSIFFALSGIMELFHYLDKGLCAILLFVGGKMLLPLGIKWLHLPESWAHIPKGVSLGVIVSILAIAIIASIIHTRLHPEANQLVSDTPENQD